MTKTRALIPGRGCRQSRYEPLVWDLRYAGATRLAGNKTAGEANIGRFVCQAAIRCG